MGSQPVQTAEFPCFSKCAKAFFFPLRVSRLMAAMGVMLRVQAMLFFFPLSCSPQFKNRRDSNQFTRTSLFFYLVYVIFVRLVFLH